MKKCICCFLITLFVISMVSCGEKYDANEIKIIESYDKMIEDARQEMKSNQEKLNEILSMLDETDSDAEARQIAVKYHPRGYSMDIFASMNKQGVYEFIKSEISTESKTFLEMQEMLESAKQENLEEYRNGTLDVD